MPVSSSRLKKTSSGLSRIRPLCDDYVESAGYFSRFGVRDGVWSCLLTGNLVSVIAWPSGRSIGGDRYARRLRSWRCKRRLSTNAHLFSHRHPLEVVSSAPSTKHMPTIFKGVLSAIVNSWKALVWILTAILLAIVIAVRWFPRALFNLLGWITATRIGTAILLVASSIFLILLLWQFPRWQVRSIVGLDSKDRFNLENEARKTLSQIFGGLILLAGFYFTWQNLVVTR